MPTAPGVCVCACVRASTAPGVCVLGWVKCREQNCTAGYTLYNYVCKKNIYSKPIFFFTKPIFFFTKPIFFLSFRTGFVFLFASD